MKLLKMQRLKEQSEALSEMSEVGTIAHPHPHPFYSLTQSLALQDGVC